MKANGKPRTAEHGPKLDPGVPLKARLAGAALRASSPVTVHQSLGPSGRAGMRMGQVQRAQVRQLPRPRTLPGLCGGPWPQCLLFKLRK